MSQFLRSHASACTNSELAVVYNEYLGNPQNPTPGLRTREMQIRWSVSAPEIWAAYREELAARATSAILSGRI
jgi:hypothetical protein